MFSSVEHSSMKQYGLERGGGAETLSLGGEKKEKEGKSKEMGQDRERGAKRRSEVQTVRESIWAWHVYSDIVGPRCYRGASFGGS